MQAKKEVKKKKKVMQAKTKVIISYFGCRTRKVQYA